MKQPLSKRWMVLPVAFLILFGSAACQASGPAPAMTQAPEVAVPETKAPTSIPETVSVEADVVFGPGPFNFPEPEAGLADLSSYKATLTLSFEGTRDGQPSQWSKTYVMQSTREPVARQLTIENTGDLSNLEAVFLAEVGGAAYEVRGATACNANVIQVGNSLTRRLEPAGFLNYVIGAEEAGVETIDNAAVDHYTFDERAFGQLGLAKSTGELWVSPEGGYIVKYVLTTKGDANTFGEGIQGTLTWEYELTDVNQPIAFTIPEDCPAGMVDAPLLPDASNVSSMPSVLSYETASGMTEIATFYQSEMVNLGWELTGEPTLTDTTALLDFKQGDQTMAIVVTTSNGTTVNVILGKSQE
jgi:hypothetical protein